MAGGPLPWALGDRLVTAPLGRHTYLAASPSEALLIGSAFLFVVLSCGLALSLSALTVSSDRLSSGKILAKHLFPLNGDSELSMK